MCSFISSVVAGSYDEYGYIYIDSSAYASDNKYNAYAQAAIRRDVVTAGQAAGIVLLSLLMVGLFIYAAYMRNVVGKKLGFTTATKEPLRERDIKRQESGIMMCRSKSNLSYKAPVHDGRMA